MKSAAAVFAITFLVVSPIFAQVHIRENATITPGQPKKVQDGLGNNHTISFEVDWQDDPSGVAAAVSGPCGTYSWIEIWSPESIVGEDSSAVLGPDGTGTITFNIPSAHEGDYSFLVQAHFTDKAFIVMTHYKIYFDGVLVKTGDYAIDLGGFTFYTKDWTTPYFSNFGFYFLDGQLYHGYSTVMWMLGLYDCTSTAWSPENPITLTIVSGSEFASFHKIDSQTGADVKVGSVLTTTVNDNEGYSLVADGIQPDSIAEWVVIEGESGGLSNTQSVQIMPPPVVVTIVPSTLSPGDTASINVKQRNPDGTISDFPPDQQFEVGISSGDTCGTILSPDGDSTADYFFSIQRGFKFIAADSIDGDSVTVGIRVGIPPANPIPSSMIPGGKGTAAQGGSVAHGASQPGNTTTSIHAQRTDVKSSSKPKTLSMEKASAKKGGLKSVSDDISFSYAGYGIGWAVIQAHAILLGETKYYQAVPDPNDATKLIFDEMNETSGWKSGGQPASFTVTPISPTDKLATYYELKDDDGIPLAGDMIRLVGRYWEEGQTYKVKLSATSGSRSGSIDIEVKKPSRLFDPKVFNKPFNETWGIRNNYINIDSLCIYYGGRIGIPPQVIKGQMYQESDKTNDHFNPSYRYEPWKDYDFLYNNPYAKDYVKQPFWITDTDPMGKGERTPMEHQNVKPIYYPTEGMSISDFAITNWSKYVNRNKLAIVGSFELTTFFRAYYFYYNYVYAPPNNSEPYAIATGLIQEGIKNEYTDKAQTRKCASYGLIQMLYTTAQVEGYNKGKSIDNSLAPEKLNDETIEMPFYQTFTENNLQLQFDNGPVPLGNWPKGWEKTWMDSFGNYNSDSGYAQSVFEHAKKFYPQP